MIIHKDNLPRRQDLDSVVCINPDEAGIFDLYLADPAPGNLETEYLMHLLQNGVNPEAVIHSATFETAGSDYRAKVIGSDYKAEVVGTPPDSPSLSVWTVRFVVKS